jgi:hypothetical protein
MGRKNKTLRDHNQKARASVYFVGFGPMCNVGADAGEGGGGVRGEVEFAQCTRSQGKTREDKTHQGKTRQDKPRQYKTPNTNKNHTHATHGGTRQQ